MRGIYDAIGNILYKAGVYYCYGYMANCADTNRLYAVKSTSEGNTFTYDANGNVLSGAGRTYTWTKDNRLDVVNGPGSAVMAYDYTGIRVKKTGTGGTTLYPFSGYEIQGSTITKHIRLGNEIVASRQGSARLFYHNDHLGGVNVISDISGTRVQLNEYDPWGKVSRSEGIPIPITGSRARSWMSRAAFTTTVGATTTRRRGDSSAPIRSCRNQIIRKASTGIPTS